MLKWAPRGLQARGTSEGLDLPNLTGGASCDLAQARECTQAATGGDRELFLHAAPLRQTENDA
jgi:hypothetical protein